jgi:RimJ/RimL family protein N-acetyltransferase
LTTLIWGLEEPLGRYLGAKFPEFGPHYRPHRAVGWADKDGRLVAALGLDYEHPWDGRLTIFAERSNFWTPRQLRELFGVAFGEWDLTRLTLWVNKRSKNVRRLVEGLGFDLEGVKRRAVDGINDECLYGMTVDRCKWVNQNAKAAAA